MQNSIVHGKSLTFSRSNIKKKKQPRTKKKKKQKQKNNQPKITYSEK